MVTFAACCVAACWPSLVASSSKIPHVGGGPAQAADARVQT